MTRSAPKLLLQPAVLAEDAAAADVFAQRHHASGRRAWRCLQRQAGGLRVAEVIVLIATRPAPVLCTSS